MKNTQSLNFWQKMAKNYSDSQGKDKKLKFITFSIEKLFQCQCTCQIPKERVVLGARRGEIVRWMMWGSHFRML